MKQLRTVSGSFTILLLFSVFIISCQKSVTNNTGTTPTDEQKLQLSISSSAQDQADNVYNDVFANVMGVNADLGIGGGIGVFGKGGGPGADSLPHCFTVTIIPLDPLVFPKTVTIDFGTGCTGTDGHTRRGKIITVYTGPMIIPGSRATTTFDGFYTDSIKVEGTHIVQNNSTGNHFIFSVKVENGKLTAPSGNFILWNKNITVTQIEGNGTIHNPLDDIFSITGTGNGTVKRGDNTVQWSAEIINPLIRKFICRWNVKGTVRLTVNGITGLLDYGNGDCDNKATLTIGTFVINITLP